MILNLISSVGPVQEFFFREHGSATYSRDSDLIFLGLFWFSFVTFVVMMSLMFYFTIKNMGWKKGMRVKRSASHNNTMELAWTIIPTLMAVVMFVVGFRAYARQIISPDQAINLDVSASKWSWEITYPNGSGATETTKTNELTAIPAPIFIIPEDTPIKLTMSSADVIHSFWVPDFRMKQDVFPNRFTTYWFQTGKLSETDRDNPDLPYPNKEHWVFCAEYCGDNHSEMAAILRVVPKNQYAAWIREPFSGDKSLVEIGQILYTSKGCVQCHTIDGSSNTGPTWQNLFGSESRYNSAAAWKIDENAIREAVYEPAAKIRQGFKNQMATYQGRVNDKELRALIAYMKKISKLTTDFDPTETWGDLDPDAAAQDGAGEGEAGETDPGDDTGG